MPLSASHRLREAINDVSSEQTVPAELLAQYDAPVLAATTKVRTLSFDKSISALMLDRLSYGSWN